MRLYPLRIVGDNINIPFMKLKNLSFCTSIALSILSLMLIFAMGLNLGIDFTGGVLIEAKMDTPVELSVMRKLLNELNVGEVSLQTFGDQNELLIKIGLAKNVDSGNIAMMVKKALSTVTEQGISYKKIDFVGPQVGTQLVLSGIQSIILCFIGIMIYVAARFEWQFGVGVMIALLHDLALSLGFMALTQLDFSISSVAALLTIVGYSVNDSVVIYDRVRENLRKYTKKTIDEVINLSTNETLSRTTMTVLTTLIANLAIIIWGGQELRSFSVLVFFGIVIGTYSSIFISAPILKILGLSSLTKNSI